MAAKVVAVAGQKHTGGTPVPLPRAKDEASRTRTREENEGDKICSPDPIHETHNRVLCNKQPAIGRLFFGLPKLWYHPCPSVVPLFFFSRGSRISRFNLPNPG